MQGFLSGRTFWISLFFCMCFLSWVFHRRTAPLFSLPFPARWGRDWKGKPCVPFSVCEGSETITKRQFLRFLQAHRAAFLFAVSGIVGKGLERETLLPFPRLRRFGTHSETGSKFLLLFSIKSKEERLCFAVRVLNWRISHLHQAKVRFIQGHE